VLIRDLPVNHTISYIAVHLVGGPFGPTFPLRDLTMDDLKQARARTQKTAIESAKAWGGKSSFFVLRSSFFLHPSSLLPSLPPLPSLALRQTLTLLTEFLLNLLIESPLPSSVLATLVFAQHARPFQATPMIFPPILLFSTYLNLQGYKVDSAGTTAAFSGLYLVLAGRRRNPFISKFGARGIIRGATMALCLANVVGGGLAYLFGSRSKENDEGSQV
jgi:hypothetical protein